MLAFLKRCATKFIISYPLAKVLYLLQYEFLLLPQILLASYFIITGFIWICSMKKYDLGQQYSSTDKDGCHHYWLCKFEPWNLYSGRKDNCWLVTLYWAGKVNGPVLLNKASQLFYGNCPSASNSSECQCQTNSCTTGMRRENSWSEEALFPLRRALHASHQLLSTQLLSSRERPADGCMRTAQRCAGTCFLFQSLARPVYGK